MERQTTLRNVDRDEILKLREFSMRLSILCARMTQLELSARALHSDLIAHTEALDPKNAQKRPEEVSGTHG